MGNRDGPARTARMRVEIQQSWARQSSGWKARTFSRRDQTLTVDTVAQRR
jgi:hypothetical protein